MENWKCKNWTKEDALVHSEQCDCSFGCNGELCLTCCEEEMFGAVYGDDEDVS